MGDQATGLRCMKCGNAVRTYKRNGITIDQCTTCHGIFLDRGELERLISAESAYLADSAPGETRTESGHPKRTGGFLGEIFD